MCPSFSPAWTWTPIHTLQKYSHSRRGVCEEERVWGEQVPARPTDSRVMGNRDSLLLFWVLEFKAPDILHALLCLPGPCQCWQELVPSGCSCSSGSLKCVGDCASSGCSWQKL